MKHGLLLQLVILTVLGGIARSPHASLIRAMPLSELVALSDAIVVGNVSSVHAAWDPQHLRILSSIEVDIEESWKGPEVAHRRITIVQPGGSVGEIAMTVQGMPRFAVGEKSLLFLQGHHDFQVVGMSQGKCSLVQNDASKQWLVQSPDTEGVVEVGPGAKLRQAKRRVPIPLNDLRERVLRAIGNSQ